MASTNILYGISSALVFATMASAAPPPGAGVGIAYPQSPEQCSSHLKSIDASERAMATIKAQSFVDNSAPRETTRLLSMLLEQQSQSMELSLLIAKHCPVYPVHGSQAGFEYLGAALECATARSGRDGQLIVDKCTIEKWRPNPTASAPQ